VEPKAGEEILQPLLFAVFFAVLPRYETPFSRKIQDKSLTNGK